MLFQTLVQLNILILATPALAGWSLLPPVHGTVRAAGIVWQFRAAETPAPTVAAMTETRRTTRLSPKRLLSLPAPAPSATIVSPAPRAALASRSVPPSAARAP